MAVVIAVVMNTDISLHFQMWVGKCTARVVRSQLHGSKIIKFICFLLIFEHKSTTLNFLCP